MSESCKKRWADGGPRKGHFDTVAAKIDMARKMTLAMNRSLAERSGVTYPSTKGTYQGSHNIPYRNELQKRSIETLETNPNVESYQFLEDAIEVSRPKRLRRKRQYNSWAMIDFIVKDKNGSKKLIFLKPKGLEIGAMKALQDIERYCVANGYDIEVWTNEQFAIVEPQSLEAQDTL